MGFLHPAAIGLGFLLDLLLGDPEGFPHPVVFMGRAISSLEKYLRRHLPPFWGGVVLAAVLPAGTFAVS